MALLIIFSFFLISDTSFKLSSVPKATQGSEDLMEETCVQIKLEEVDQAYNNIDFKDPNEQSIKLECLKESPTTEYDSKEMFRNPHHLAMVQIENFELFEQERENETGNMGNDIFYESSISPTFNAEPETYESIVKIEAETIQSTTGYEAFNNIDTEETTDGEVKGETSESVNNRNRNDDGQRECYICKHCSKDFMYFGNYAKHLDQHSVGKLMCKFCHQTFGR